jgi:hypothetical protein
METRIATGIDTELFYSIIKYLTKTGWRVSLEYSTKLFDKGIDFDLYQLNKNGETILFAWTNWFEGELKTSSTIIDNIEQQFSIKFKFGEPEHLNKENIVEEMKELLDFK